MNPIVAIQADPVLKLNPLADGTLRLAGEAQKRGFEVFFYEVCDLALNQSQVVAYGKFVELADDYSIKYQSALTKFNLSQTKFLLIRQDPPFNMTYITATYILDNLPNSVRVLNPTQALRNVSEKTSIAKLDHILPTLITQNRKEILDFCTEYNDVVLKPLYSFGGQGVVRLQFNSQNFMQDVDSYLNHGEPVMLQPYYEHVKNGEKRVVWLNNKWVGAFLKIPNSNDFRANTVYHSTIQPYRLTPDDEQHLKQLADYLKANNIFFAGIDIMESYINEINITSVGAFVSFNQTNSLPLEKLFWDAALCS